MSVKRIYSSINVNGRMEIQYWTIDFYGGKRYDRPTFSC